MIRELNIVPDNPNTGGKIKVVLKSISIKNFKNIEKEEYRLEKLNEFYGKNRTGKSSILDALRFVFYGGKNDVDKIQVGKDKTEVEVSLIENETPMEIKTTLDRKGNLKCVATVNGVRSGSPRSLIKRMISFGTFNPREMLEKEGRKERLLSLVPIFIKKEDVVIPDDGRPFPIHDPNSIDYSKHAFEVLQAIYKDMYNMRKDINRERDIFKKSHLERENQYNENSITFQKNYGVLPKEVKVSLEEASANLGKLKEKKKNFLEHIESTKKTINQNTDKISDNEAKAQLFKTKIEEYKKEIEKMEGELRVLDGLKNVPKENLEQAKIDKQVVEKALSETEPEINKTEKDIMIARQASRLGDEAESVKKAYDQFKKKEEEWKVMDTLLKNKWPIFVTKVLEPIKDQVPGLKVETGGGFTYNGVSLDELSGAESIDLSLKLMKAETKSNLIVIDEFEALDKESIDKTNWEDWTALVARVSDDPIGEGWNSVKMDKPEKQEE